MPGGKDGNECIPVVQVPGGPQCCPAGQIQAATTGKCCPADNLTTGGMCCPTAVDPNNRTSCPEEIQSIEKCVPGYTKMPNGTCCSNRLVSPDGKTCRSALPPRKTPPRSSGCPAGMVRDRDGDCVPREPEGGQPYQPPTEQGPRNPFPGGGQPPGFQPPGRSGPPATSNPGTFAPGRH